MAKRAKRATPRRDATGLPVGGFCETCRWWDRRRETTSYEAKSLLIGMCRAGGPNPGCEPPWPFTAVDDWCAGYERATEWDETRRDEHVV